MCIAFSIRLFPLLCNCLLLLPIQKSIFIDPASGTLFPTKKENYVMLIHTKRQVPRLYLPFFRRDILSFSVWNRERRWRKTQAHSVTLDATLKEKLQQNLGLGWQALKQRADLPKELGSHRKRQDSNAGRVWCITSELLAPGTAEVLWWKSGDWRRAAQSTSMRHSSLVPQPAILL